MERPEPYVNERLDHPWIVATITVNQEQVVQQAFRDGCWIVGTNVLETGVLSDQQLIAAYKGQSSH